MQNRHPRNDIGILERLLAFDRANEHQKGKCHPLLNGRIPLQIPKRHPQSLLNNRVNLKNSVTASVVGTSSNTRMSA